MKMHCTSIVLSTLFAGAFANPQTSSTGIAIGQQCDPSVANVCAGGANCYATNSMLMPLCGNFQSSCTTDAQCAFNTCNGGLCNGFIATSSSTQSAAPKPTGTSLPLGAACDPALAGACANDVDCWATNYMLQPRCGNTQAKCSRDDQCAFQNCFGGICSGPPVFSKTATTSEAAPTTTSTSGPAETTVTASNPILTTSRATPTGGSNVTMSGNPTMTPSATATPPLEANGAGKIEGSLVGLFGLIFAALLL